MRTEPFPASKAGSSSRRRTLKLRTLCFLQKYEFWLLFYINSQLQWQHRWHFHLPPTPDHHWNGKGAMDLHAHMHVCITIVHIYCTIVYALGLFVQRLWIYLKSSLGSRPHPSPACCLVLLWNIRMVPLLVMVERKSPHHHKYQHLLNFKVLFLCRNLWLHWRQWWWKTPPKSQELPKHHHEQPPQVLFLPSPCLPSEN